LGGKPTAYGPVEVLTDTRGVDFGPYMTRVLRDIRQNWYRVIPESAASPRRKRGDVTIEFAILKNGTISGMRMVSISCDASLDQAAWTGITASSPFSPLPNEFAGECLGLRFTFHYNSDNVDDQVQCVTTTIHLAGEIGVTVSPGSVQLVSGTKQQFLAAVTGDMNSAVNWSVGGPGCVASSCGVISDEGLYTAPLRIPDPATVTVTATLATTPSQTASATVTVVQPNPSH